MDEIKLKPCPFCGSTDPFMFTCSTCGSDEKRYGFYCRLCKTKGPQAPSEELAAKAWNRRSMTAMGKPRYVLNKKALQHYLIDHDLTQADFAKTLGISTSYFNELMNGRKSISISNMFSIAEETHMDIRVFLEKVDE